jgi:hypothetical protein
MLPKIIIGLLILTMSATAFAQKRNWQKAIEQIKLLEMTKADVEKLLGKPDEDDIDSVDYEFKDGRLNAVYSQGRCQSRWYPVYNVEKDVVVKLDFNVYEFKRKIKFKSLGIDVSKLENRGTERVWDTSAVVTYYYDAKKEIYYSTYHYGSAKEIYYDVDKELLSSVTVYPLSIFDNLKCSN